MEVAVVISTAQSHFVMNRVTLFRTVQSTDHTRSVLPSLQQRLLSINNDTTQEADGTITEGRLSAVRE
jgi:hypothetical protein